ncbi:MAG: hypothetical protein QM692_10545 [Thermomicrobiales bacterium]
MPESPAPPGASDLRRQTYLAETEAQWRQRPTAEQVRLQRPGWADATPVEHAITTDGAGRSADGRQAVQLGE